jgi:hypothetical protein
MLSVGGSRSGRYLGKPDFQHDASDCATLASTGLRDQQTPTYARIKLDSGPAHHGPEAVFQDKPFADAKSNDALLLTPMLITPDCQ